MKLDSRDYRILYEMDRNCRQPISQIAKKIKLSKDSTIYRIKRLEKEGLILRYQAYLNHGKLGYISARINIKLQNTTPGKEEEIINFIKEQPPVGFFTSVEGNVNLVVWLIVRGVNDLDDFWKTLVDRYNNYIARTELGIYTKIEHYPRIFFVGGKINEEMLIFTEVGALAKIEKKDLEILKILAKNARENLVSIAGKLKITAKTVSKKIRDLEKRGVITGFSALFDMEKLGYGYYKIYFDFQNAKKQDLKSLDIFVRKHPNIVFRDYVIGGHSCEVEVQVKNENELRELLDDIKKKFSFIIKDYEVLNYYKEHKMLSMPWAE